MSDICAFSTDHVNPSRETWPFYSFTDIGRAWKRENKSWSIKKHSELYLMRQQVLTSRIAQLILTHKLEPSSICAVTFTNKAANEMRERLTKLIGKAKTTALQMGTFHSLCARFLRKHSQLVNLETNFTICDADERYMSARFVVASTHPSSTRQ